MRDAVDVPVPSGTQVLAGPALAANTTYHVVVTDDGTTMRIYVNGAQVATSPDGVALKNTDAGLRIGAKAGGGTGDFTGTIDEPAIYNAALAAVRDLEPLPHRHQLRPDRARHDAAGQARHADRGCRRRLGDDQPVAAEHRRRPRVLHAPAQADLAGAASLGEREDRRHRLAASRTRA